MDEPPAGSSFFLRKSTPGQPVRAGATRAERATHTPARSADASGAPGFWAGVQALGLRWRDRLIPHCWHRWLLARIRTRMQLTEVLRAAAERHVIDNNLLGMLEGSLAISEMRVRDVMVPRSQMHTISVHDAPDQFISYISSTGNSRLPVWESDRDNIIGILLAKDVLRFYIGEDFNLRDVLRPAVFIPESKRLSTLLKDFLASRNHMAIVVDEYGTVAGLVTIEDVIEQVVGEIEDEYDFDETLNNIALQGPGCWRVRGITPLEDLNAALGSHFNHPEVDTVGGLALAHFGHLPQREESVQIGDYRFHVLRADGRRLYSLQIDYAPPPAAGETSADSTHLDQEVRVE